MLEILTLPRTTVTYGVSLKTYSLPTFQVIAAGEGAGAGARGVMYAVH